ncbi:Uncharacterized protein FKW44_015025 [Caligus rogercresseyi]|uniref:Uncharacterized protein n=1 Tax=Caligus rogercresseyi TaxID=217165 RepID=A0A7T8K049_CALRO|nr:Uncharacterized protein FKW44_015025 [Caligus rogercresseyi]
MAEANYPKATTLDQDGLPLIQHSEVSRVLHHQHEQFLVKGDVAFLPPQILSPLDYAVGAQKEKNKTSNQCGLPEDDIAADWDKVSEGLYQLLQDLPTSVCRL